jgi:hypothetical protein
MNDHLVLMIVFALFVSVVFATIMRDDPKEQIRYGGRLFAAFVVGGILAGWILYPFPL